MRVNGHLSHRGRGLVLIGTIWATVAVATWLGIPPRVPGPVSVIPDHASALLWLIPAAAAVFTPLWPGSGTRYTKWVFAALVIPASLRMFSYAFDFLSRVLHLTPRGHLDSWIGAVAWALVLAMVLHEASAPMLPTRTAPNGSERGPV